MFNIKNMLKVILLIVGNTRRRTAFSFKTQENLRFSIIDALFLL